MSDRELLEEMFNGLKSMMKDIEDLKATQKDIKRQLMKSTAELKAMDDMIFDEVERVHEILNRHTDDKSLHLSA